MVSNDLIIPSHWDCKPLVDCTSNKNISYGIVQPGQHDESGIGIIRVNNFENGELNTSEVLKVTPREGANKRGNSSRLTQSFHFFMFEPIFSPVNALNQPI